MKVHSNEHTLTFVNPSNLVLSVCLISKIRKMIFLNIQTEEMIVE